MTAKRRRQPGEVYAIPAELMDWSGLDKPPRVRRPAPPPPLPPLCVRTEVYLALQAAALVATTWAAYLMVRA